MQNPHEITNIVIAGGGSAGWMTAAVLSTHLPKGRVKIRLVESDQIGIIGVGESTIPPFLGLIHNLGIDLADFTAKCQGTFKLAIRFQNWLRKDHTYYHPFGQIGAPVDGNAFYQAWLKAKLEGHPSNLQDFAPATIMADMGRMMLPQVAPKSPIANASYALHIDAHLVAKYLRNHAETRGVQRTEGMIADVNLHENGFIKSLTLQSGEEIEGDLFIDCTGFRAVLIEKALKVGYTSWADELFCDRAVACQTDNISPPPPYTLADAQDYGWRWRIPLQHRSGNGYVFASEYLSDEDATKVLLSKIEGEPTTKPMIVPFKTGIRKEVWSKNCLSIGLSTGFIEPLESTAIHLMYRTLDFFFRYFPDKRFDPASQAEFNRRIIADYTEVKDFVVMHYCLTEREDTPFWKRVKNQEISDDLRARIATFRVNGALAEHGPEELFKDMSWYSVLDGMGVRPDHCNTFVNRLDSDGLKRMLDDVKPPLRDFVETLPTHSEFLKQYCPAKPISTPVAAE